MPESLEVFKGTPNWTHGQVDACWVFGYGNILSSCLSSNQNWALYGWALMLVFWGTSEGKEQMVLFIMIFDQKAQGTDTLRRISLWLSLRGTDLRTKTNINVNILSGQSHIRFASLVAQL